MQGHGHSHEGGGSHGHSHGNSSGGISPRVKQNLLVIFVIVAFLTFLFLFQAKPIDFTIVHYAAEVPCDPKEIHFDPTRVKHISWSPRVFVYENFLSDEECEHMIQKGVKAGLELSLVAGPGSAEANAARTSYGTFLDDDGDAIARAIEDRVARWAQIPIEHGENFYLLRYQVGQQYKPHHDFFHLDLPGVENFLGPSGQRTVTALLYLETPLKGGETIFPALNLTIPVVKGSAVLFWSTLPTIEEDYRSLHGGLPVIEGTKWCLTKWLRIKKHHDRRPLRRQRKADVVLGANDIAVPNGNNLP